MFILFRMKDVKKKKRFVHTVHCHIITIMYVYMYVLALIEIHILVHTCLSTKT